MAEDLWKLRQRKGMTAQQLAAKSGVPLALIQEYEGGKRAIRSTDLPKLARALFVEEWDIKDLSNPAPARPAESARPQAESTASAPPPRPAPPPARPAPPPERERPPERGAPPLGPMPSREQPAPPPARPAAPPSRPAPPERERPAAPPDRAPRERRPPQPPGPARPTQITHLLGLVSKLGLDQAALEADIGKPVDQLNFLEARRWLGEYQRRLRERRALAPETSPSAAAEARHRAHLPESVDGFEANYLTEHQQAGTRLRFKLFNGETFEGRILGYGPYNIALRQDDGTEINLQKLAVAYYTTHSAAETGADQKDAPEGGAA